jgi:hypothetical protein
MKMVGKTPQPLLVSYFNSEMGTRDLGRESGIGYTGIQNRNNSI